MIVVRVELHPHSRPGTVEVLGTATIENDGTGTASSGNYVGKFRLKRKDTWRSAGVMGFPRSRLYAWDLLYRLLREAVGERSPVPGSPLPELGAAYWKQRALDAEEKIGLLARLFRKLFVAKDEERAKDLATLVDEVVVVLGLQDLPRDREAKIATDLDED